MGRLVEVTDGVWAAISSIDMMTTTVVSSGSGECLVVDAGVTPAEITALAGEIRSLGLRAVVGWSTHAHWDHLLWSKQLGMPPRFATTKTASVANSMRGKMAVQAQKALPGLELNLLGMVKPVPGGGTLPWSGPEVTVIEHCAHVDGHGALFVNGPGVLIAGDTCSEVEVPTLDLEASNPVGDYRDFLDRVMQLEGVKYVVPGHGSPTDFPGLLYRVMRDRVYLDYLAEARTTQDNRLEGTSGWFVEHHRKQYTKLHPVSSGF
jgi:hydroxyacylglutathione hydrolase